jgi:hypothetical protein
VHSVEAYHRIRDIVIRIEHVKPTSLTHILNCKQLSEESASYPIRINTMHDESHYLHNAKYFSLTTRSVLEAWKHKDDMIRLML